MTKIWVFAKQNFDVLLTIAAAIIVIILDLLNIVQPDIIAAATLMILSLIGVSLLLNRLANHRLQTTIDTALQRMHQPSAEQVLSPFKEHVPAIEQRFWSSKEVWILSRTCSGLWANFRPQFEQLLSTKGSLRIMLVDPEDGAGKMIVNSAEWDRANNLPLWRAIVQDFLEQLAKRKANLPNEKLQVKTIDYLPAWTVLLLDPDTSNGTIFVELSTYQSNNQNRPTFMLNAEQDQYLYSLFLEEFKEMWKDGRSAWQNAAVDTKA
jgi:hypothetical protein